MEKLIKNVIKKIKIAEIKYQNEPKNKLELLENELLNLFTVYNIQRYYNVTPDYGIAKYIINLIEQLKNQHNKKILYKEQNNLL